MSDDHIATLLRSLKSHYKVHGRAHLPWRRTRDPYKILVSEVMLQQTQVERVIPKYEVFIKAFPTAKKLSHATLPQVLKLWQGLGYNRRGKMLRDAAAMLEGEFREKFPKSAASIERLPGVGPYTARAVATFAFNAPEAFIETNIRTVFFHHFFSDAVHGKVSDAELLPLVEEALRRSNMEPRDFYAALMDYGSFLKRSGVRINSKSAHYAKQSKFEGSRRELRGQILRSLLEKPLTLAALAKGSGRGLAEVKEELARLQKEKLIAQNKNSFFITK